MKNDYISIEKKRHYQQMAHIERSQAFHDLTRPAVNSVKFLFSQPEAVSRKIESKISKLGKPKDSMGDCPA